MGVHTQWANDEQKILLTTIEVPWTWEEMEVSSTETNKYIESVAHQVDTILDVTHLGAMPEDGLRRFIELGRHSHPRAGRTVIVGSNLFLQIAANATNRVISRVSRHAPSVVFAASIEEAYQVLKQG